MLGPGAIAGIVLGAVGGVAIIAALVLVFLYYRKKNKYSFPEDAPKPVDGELIFPELLEWKCSGVAKQNSKASVPLPLWFWLR